jgi:lipoprotein-releasing system ATP-binding protein
MSAVLDARGIVKQFVNGDEVSTVLRGVDVTLDQGELIALLGPSGSGKSTLMSILGLLLRPTAGEINILGERLTGQSDRMLSNFRSKHLGFVFQFHHLLPDFTATENVVFPAAGREGHISQAMVDRAHGLLERVGLSARRDYKATRLSGGQKQRVAIARSLMNRPSLVFADEPTGNLDRESSAAVMTLIREINRQDHTTFLICTHDPTIAAQCDRRIIVVDGAMSSEDEAHRLGLL